MFVAKSRTKYMPNIVIDTLKLINFLKKSSAPKLFLRCTQAILSRFLNAWTRCMMIPTFGHIFVCVCVGSFLYYRRALARTFLDGA